MWSTARSSSLLPIVPLQNEPPTPLPPARHTLRVSQRLMKSNGALLKSVTCVPGKHRRKHTSRSSPCGGGRRCIAAWIFLTLHILTFGQHTGWRRAKCD